MAILKHISSKSANYGRAMEYLMYEQDRLTNRSRVDEDGDLVMRDNFLINSLECNVATSYYIVIPILYLFYRYKVCC